MNNPHEVPASKTCIKCGSVFTRTMNGAKGWMLRKFCSRKCSGTAKDCSLPMTRICQICGVEFGRAENLSASLWRGRRMCSTECAGIHHRTHGDTASKEYSIWTNMKTRCLNPKSDDYQNYGGRGIQICSDWLSDFGRFLRDMGRCPDGMSLDRKNTDEGYSPENCKWATVSEQCNNRRNNIRISFNGETKTLKQWSDSTGIPYHVMASRRNRGLSVSQIIGVEL